MRGSDTASENTATRTASLRIHLLVLVASALLPMLVLGIGATWIAGRQLHANSLQRLQATASMLAAAVDEGITGQMAEMAALSRLRHHHDDVAMQWQQSQESGSHLRLVNLDRDPVAAQLPKAHLQALQSDDQPRISTVFHPASSPAPLVAITAPVLPGFTRLTLLQPSNELINLVPSNPKDQSALVALVDSNGHVAARSHNPQNALGKPVPDWQELQAVGRDHGQFEARTQEGKEVVFAFQKLSSAPGWVLVVGEPLDTFQAAWKTPVKGIMIGGLIALLLALTTAQLLSRRILRSVGSLTRRSRLVADGMEAPAMAARSSVTEFEQLRSNLGDAEAALQQRARDAGELAHQLERSQRRYRAVAEAGALVFWEADARGAMLATAGWSELTGRAESDALGRGWEKRIHPEDLPAIASGWAVNIREGSALDMEFRVEDAAGQWHWVRARGAQVGSLAVPEWAGVLEDVDARRKAQADIAWLAHHDPLTGLANRAVFHQRLEHAIEQAARGARAAVLCLDLDRFKEVNDSLGHPIGDLLLQQVARRLQEHVRHADTLARLGGDEFAILIHGTDPAEEARILASRLLEAIALPYQVSGHSVVIGLSLGISMVEDHRCGRDRILQNADLALYKAKEQGRGCFRFFEAQMDAQMQQRRSLEMDLRQGMAEGQFCIHYQPLVDLASRRLNGFEALLRWQHPSRGLLQPDSFLPLANEIGLITPLGQWVLEQACRDAAQWTVPLKVAVNLAASQLNGLLHQRVMQALEKAGLPASRLELEVTENALFSHIEAATPSLLQLKAAGVTIVMDDFGTGYSSLGYLRAFPFDKVKIDKSYVHDLVTDSNAGAVINAVTVLCNQLGITTTIEGVETAMQLQLISGQPGGEGQGFLFGHPCGNEQVDAVIQRYCARA